VTILETVLLFSRARPAIATREMGCRSLIKFRITERFMFLTTREFALIT
jgi:hypothetical protein